MTETKGLQYLNIQRQKPKAVNTFNMMGDTILTALLVMKVESRSAGSVFSLVRVPTTLINRLHLPHRRVGRILTTRKIPESMNGVDRDNQNTF
jgi:hypothetical protein